MLNQTKKSQAGVTLVELMIAMVVGLIVIGAAIALAVSLMKANNDSIRSTRLSQEMRALADVAAMEIRRARSLEDPLANVGLGATAFVTCNAITPSADGKCLTFAYGCNPINGNGKFQTISLSGSSMFLATEPAAAPACGTGDKLNSDDLVITSATFAETPTKAIRMTLVGHPSSDANMKRTLTRVIWPRSAPVVP